jgi:hypothetical protein
MARNFLTPINLNKLELQDAVIQNKIATTINGMTPVAGQVYYDSTNNVLRVATGTATTSWLTVATNQTTGAYTSAITIGGTSINIGATASSLSNVSISGSGTWTATSIAVANGGTGTATGSITGTGALTFTAGGTNTNVNLVPNGTGTVDVASKKITNLATPTADTDAATKAYVDATSQGLDVKASVKVATTANITLIATQTIDTVAVVAGDRVLVKNQTAGAENGIWVVGSGNWTRATDADSTAKLTSGAFVFIEQGSQADNGWVLTTDTAITIGTTSQTWSQFSGAGAITAGDGITKSGNTLSVSLDSSPVGLKFNTGKLAVDASQLWIGTSNVVLSGTTPISQALTGILSVTGTTAAMSITPAARTGIGAGYSVTITGGATDTSTAGSANLYGGTSTAAAAAGGAVTIAGGNGTGAASGGAVTIDGGTSGSGTYGKVNIGTQSNAIDIGQISTPSITRLLGTVQLTSLASGSDTNFVKFNATSKTLTYDSNSYANLAAANSFVFAGTQTFKYSAATDSIILAPRNGGSASYGISLTTGTLTASGTLTLPDTGGATQQVARIVSGTSVLTAANTIAATHNLKRQLVHAQLFDSSYNLVETDIVLTSDTVTTFNFAANQTATYYWVITG